MAKEPLRQQTLPLNLPRPAAHPRGEVFNTGKPYTLPLNKKITLTRCVGRYTEVDRKLWATLAALAWDNLATKSIHEANLRDIARLFRELKGGKNGVEWLMASAERLRQTGLNWEDDEERGTVSLLSGLKIKKQSGTIFYQFPDFLIERLLDNKQFSRLRLHFMIGLSGKYSVSLYMLLEAAANCQRPVIELTIDALRDALSVPVDKLGEWFDLKRKAIDPAIKEINDNPIAAGFSVECEPVTRGRKVESVRFTVTKTNARREIEGDMTRKKSARRSVSAATPRAAALDEDAALDLIRKHAPRMDAHWIWGEWQTWANATPPKNPAGALVNFAKKKYEENKHHL
jgi:hypothetical protein